MPIVFSLSSWAIKQQPLAEWLVEELNTRYQVPHHLSEEWVKTDQVIPLLDGLDEVASSRRAACINAINAFRKANFVPIVVCSRTEEYSAQHARLELLAAVIIQPLQEEQIDDALRTEKLAPLRAEIQMNDQLSTLVDTPLMLKTLMLASYDKPVEALITKGSAEEQQRKIFETYVEQMYKRRAGEAGYPEQETKYWLQRLAQLMKRHNLVEFSPEQLQVDWLAKGVQLKLYHIFYYLLFGIGGAVIIGPLLDSLSIRSLGQFSGCSPVYFLDFF